MHIAITLVRVARFSSTCSARILSISAATLGRLSALYVASLQAYPASFPASLFFMPSAIALASVACWIDRGVEMSRSGIVARSVLMVR